VLTLFGIALAAGLALGIALGGRPRRLAELRLRGQSLALAGVLIQVAMGRMPRSLRPTALGLSLVLVATWLAVNRTQPRGVALGFAAVGAGLALNAIVIVANGMMPVEPAALRGAGISGSVNVAQGHHAKHLLAGSSTRLAFLDDRLPIRALHAVVSVGDLVLLAGIAGVIAFAMRPGHSSPLVATQAAPAPTRVRPA